MMPGRPRAGTYINTMRPPSGSKRTSLGSDQIWRSHTCPRRVSRDQILVPTLLVEKIDVRLDSIDCFT